MSYPTDPDIKAIMPPRGDDLAMELLGLIDFDLLSQPRPKWFVGSSDPSTFHSPLTMISGWTTLHGPNLMDFSARKLDATAQAMWEALESNRGAIIRQYPSTVFQTDENQRGATSDRGSNLTQKVQWKRLDGAVSSLALGRRLTDGYLKIISRLAGTPLGDVPLFKTSNSPQGIIPYFENVEMALCELTRALFSSRLQDWSDNLNGAPIDRSATPDVNDPIKHNHLDVLKTAFENVAVSVLYDVDIGYMPPQISLVNGADATVSLVKNGGWVTQ